MSFPLDAPSAAVLHTLLDGLLYMRGFSSVKIPHMYYLKYVWTKPVSGAERIWQDPELASISKLLVAM